ncbi:MAG TPA: TIGR01777 family protein [Prolixibacteraceae bacterium]|nr:TIGR01777 family protein [Prolixibacteraceae bacterium]
MKIKITGQSGYLGNIITKELSAHGHSITAISRNLLYGDVDLLKNELSGADVIIHLAGSPILTRWNTKNRRIITESRVVTTQNLVKAIKKLNSDDRPKKFIQASAIGIYKAFENHDENSQNFDTGFVGNVVKQWENASEDLPAEIKRTVLRIGLVIGKKAKTITNLLLPFQLGLGAKIGNGKQPFPFIHDADVAGAFLWAAENDSAYSIFNLVAPQQISNNDFTKALAKALHRPALFIIPEFVLKMILGEAAMLLTDIPGVIPKNLISAGFKFRYQEIESALKDIVNVKS